LNFKKKSYLYDRVGTRYHILLIWILGFTRRLAIFLVSLTDCVSLTERGQQEFVPDKFLPNKDHAGAGASIHPKLFYHLFLQPGQGLQEQVFLQPLAGLHPREQNIVNAWT